MTLAGEIAAVVLFLIGWHTCLILREEALAARRWREACDQSLSDLTNRDDLFHSGTYSRGAQHDHV